MVGKEWRFLAGDQGCFSGEVSIRAEPVKVCARFGETKVFDVLLGYGIGGTAGKAAQTADVGSNIPCHL